MTSPLGCDHPLGMADGTIQDSHIKATTQVISSSTAQIPAHRRFSGLNPQQTPSSFRSKTAMASSVSPCVFWMILSLIILDLWYNSRHNEHAALKSLTELLLIASALGISSVCTVIDNKILANQRSRIRSVKWKLLSRTFPCYSLLYVTRWFKRLSRWMNSSSACEHWDDSYWAVLSPVQFMMLYKVVLSFGSLNENLQCEHRNACER